MNADPGRRIRALMPDLLAYFLRRTPSPEDAADLMGETVLVLWRRHADQPDGEDELRRFAYGVARRVLLQSRRGLRRRVRLDARLAAELAVAVRAATADETVDVELESALAALTAPDRELVALIVWDGFGVAEAGALLGLRPDAARQRYGRARSRLRTVLSEHERAPRVSSAG